MNQPVHKNSRQFWGNRVADCSLQRHARLDFPEAEEIGEALQAGRLMRRDRAAP